MNLANQYCDLIGDFKILLSIIGAVTIVAMTPVIVTRPYMRLDKINLNVDTMRVHVES